MIKTLLKTLTASSLVMTVCAASAFCFSCPSVPSFPSAKCATCTSTPDPADAFCPGTTCAQIAERLKSLRERYPYCDPFHLVDADSCYALGTDLAAVTQICQGYDCGSDLCGTLPDTTPLAFY